MIAPFALILAAAVVFIASILVPMFKLIGLAVMLGATMMVTTERGAAVLLSQRTKLYYIVAWVGRWSMVDIFMESLLGALVVQAFLHSLHQQVTEPK